MNKGLVTYEGELPATISNSPDQLIALALEKNADPTTLEKLMDLQERWESGNARKAYVTAMASFKQAAPAVLVKGDRANFGAGKASYSYANLGSIVQEISALLGKYALSASWETGQDDKGLVVVSCHITHVAGHRESVTLRGPADTSGSKNPIQAIGSTVTYLQRYTLLAALGLATGEDDDGRGGKPPVQQPQAQGKPAETRNSSNNREARAIKDPDSPASEAQTKAIYAICKSKGYENDLIIIEVNSFLNPDGSLEFQPLESTKELTKQQASDFINYIQGKE